MLCIIMDLCNTAVTLTRDLLWVQCYACDYVNSAVCAFKKSTLLCIVYPNNYGVINLMISV